MANGWRLGALFASGLLLGAAAAGKKKEGGKEAGGHPAHDFAPDSLHEAGPRHRVEPGNAFSDGLGDGFGDGFGDGLGNSRGTRSRSAPDFSRAATGAPVQPAGQPPARRSAGTESGSYPNPQPRINPDPGPAAERSNTSPLSSSFKWRPESAPAMDPAGPLPDFSAEAEPAFQPPQTEGPARRHLILFASLFLLAAAAVVAAVMGVGSDEWQSLRGLVMDEPPRQAPLAARQDGAVCQEQPLATPAGPRDGRFPVHEEVAGLLPADVASFLIVGKDAAASGRVRDAESAFLMSCRAAIKLRGAYSAESADAQYQLGSLYTRLAAESASAGAGAGAGKEELRRRAQLLFAGSSQTYTALYGPTHEKTLLATGALTLARQTLAQQPAVPAPQSATPATAAQTATVAPPAPTAAPALASAADVPDPPAAAPPPAEPPPSAADAQEATVPAPSRTAASRQPKDRRARVDVAKADTGAAQSPLESWPRAIFGCARTPSLTEQLVCSDAELGRLDREMSRLYARAQSLAPDRAAFKRQQDEEWRVREAICRDKECLVRWYAQRREQLSSVIEQRAHRARVPVRRGSVAVDRTSSGAELYRGK